MDRDEKEKDMQQANENRELDREFERLRAKAHGLSRPLEKAFLKTMSDMMAHYADKATDAEERQLRIENEKLKGFLYKDLISESDPMTVEEALKFLEDIQPAALYKRIRSGTVLAFQKGREYYIPSWQFDLSKPDKMVPGFARLMKVMKQAGVDVENTILWLSRPYPGLGNEKPIDALRKGRVEEVISFGASLGGGHR